jgi:hypothetical protein
MDKKSVYVQGIFSTAITKLLIDNDFELAFPSKTIIKRLKLTKFNEDWNAAIISNPYPFGLKIIGEKEIINEIIKIFDDKLQDIIVNKSKINLGSVFVGEVISNEDNKSKITVGQYEGYVAGKFPLNTKLIVSIKEPVFKQPINFWIGLCIIGKFLMLIQNGDIKIPPIMANKGKGQILLKEIEGMLPLGWGAEIFETCINANENFVKKEILELIKEKEKLASIKSENVGEIKSGYSYVEVYLTYYAKRVLDKIRDSVLPTVEEHHYLRNFGEKSEALIRFAEELLPSFPSKELIKDKLIQSIIQTYLKPGKILKIEHYLPNDEVVNLTPGKIIEVNAEEKEVKLLRRMMGHGVYDGLNEKKMFGDYCIAKYKLGSMASELRYFRKDGNLIGIYVNISTPVEFYENSIRYVDLGIDVVKDKEGNVKIIEEDKLEHYYNEGYINTRIYEKVLKIVEEEKERIMKIS